MIQQRGFMVFHVTRRKFHTEYHYVSKVTKKEKYRHYCEATFEVHRDQKGHMVPAVRWVQSVWRVCRDFFNDC